MQMFEILILGVAVVFLMATLGIVTVAMNALVKASNRLEKFIDFIREYHMRSTLSSIEGDKMGSHILSGALEAVDKLNKLIEDFENRNKKEKENEQEVTD